MATVMAKAISLKGSTEIVAEYLQFGMNAILYQRGIYPPELFASMNKYGLQIFTTTDQQLKSYIEKITSQLRGWID
jgi:mitotic spindle assembly checkpoint protein MAD2